MSPLDSSGRIQGCWMRLTLVTLIAAMLVPLTGCPELTIALINAGWQNGKWLGYKTVQGAYSAVPLYVPGAIPTISGLQRKPDGSFRKSNYSVTGGTTFTQQSSEDNAEILLYYNLPPRPTPQPLPTGWKAGGDPLTGRGSTNVAYGDFLNNGTSFAYCTALCGNTGAGRILTARLDASYNVAAQQQYTVTGSTPQRLIAADVNGDGLRDLIVVGLVGSQGRVSVYLLNANGSLGAPANFDISAVTRNVAAFDVDRDGRLDLVTGNDNGFSVLLGNGDGTFKTPASTTVPNVISGAAIALADLNNDNRADVVLSAPGLLVVALGNGNGTFQAARTFAVDGQLDYVGIADLNKDGKPDIAVADSAGATIAILLGDGTGNFAQGNRYATGESNHSFFLMDFDLDGNLDIVFSEGHPDFLWPNVDDGILTVLFGVGDGGFYSSRAYSAGRGGIGSVVADFNGDGRPDWARARSLSNTIDLFIGLGGVEFRATPVTVAGVSQVGAIAAGDFNRDGWTDLVVTESSSTNFYTLLGRGDGTFQAPIAFAGGVDAFQMTAGDVNGDNRIDIAYTDGLGAVYVQLGNGAGGFLPAASYAAGAFPAAVQIRDLNADGKPDLLVTNRGSGAANSGSVSVYTGRGDGTFNSQVTYAAGVRATAAAIADLNGDGRPDFVVSATITTSTTYRLVPFFNQANGTFVAQSAVETTANPQEIAVADFDGDGKPDLLVSHCCGTSSLALHNGNGNGTFQAERWILFGLGERDVKAVDLNSDGKPDILATHGAFQSSLMAILNAGTFSASPTLATPAPGSRLTGSSVTFTWGAVSGATKYRLDIGSTTGASDIFSQETTGTSLTVTTLPQDGRTLYVQVSAFVGGAYGTPSASSYVAATVATPLRFVPLTPCRLMETRAAYNFEGRTGSFGPPSLNATETRTMNLPASNVCSIPSTAKAYVVNVTVIPSTTVSYVTLWPAGETRPNTWTIRSPDGQIVANSAIVKAGAGGGISVYASDRTDLLIDISGYYTDSTAVSGLVYYPLTPCRVIDTRSLYRSPAGPFGPPTMTARETRKFRFPAAGQYCSIPAAAAYSVTLTAVPPGPLAYMTAWPDGGTQPNVSSINSFAGRVLANSVIIPASSDGTIDVFAFDTTDFLVDINGYYAPDDGQKGLYYYTVTQCRASDSTVSGGAYPDETARTLNIPSASGCSGIPSNAQGYAINVTALPGGNPMPFLTAYPTGQARPNASILNAFQGQIVTNSAIIPAGTNGAIDVYAYRRTDVVVEVSGYFGR